MGSEMDLFRLFLLFLVHYILIECKRKKEKMALYGGLFLNVSFITIGLIVST